MTKKQYNKNPQVLSEAINIIVAMDGDITNLETESAQKDNKITELNDEITKLKRQSLNPNPNTQALQARIAELEQELATVKNDQASKPLTKDEIMASAKGFGMKTDQEFQQAIKDSKKDTPDKEGNYSWLWGVGAIMVFFIGLGWIKNRAKIS